MQGMLVGSFQVATDSGAQTLVKNKFRFSPFVVLSFIYLYVFQNCPSDSGGVDSSNSSSGFASAVTHNSNLERFNLFATFAPISPLFEILYHIF